MHGVVSWGTQLRGGQVYGIRRYACNMQTAHKKTPGLASVATSGAGAVELSGFEPLTSAVRLQRSTN